MVLAAVRYSAAISRVRGASSRLLRAETWQTLLSANDLDAVIVILQRTPYAGDIYQLEPLQVHIRRRMTAASRKPLSLLQRTPRDVIEWYWKRFEVYDLKLLLRGIISHMPSDMLRAYLITAQVSKLNWDALLREDDISGVINQLEGERYAAALDEAHDRFRSTGNVFILETALDRLHDQRMLKLIEGLSGRDKEDALDFIGLMLDARILLQAFRYRIHFELSPEEILTYSLDRAPNMNPELLRRIATGRITPQQAVRTLWGDNLPGLDRIAELSPAQALPELESMFRRYRHQRAEEAFTGYPFHYGLILAFLVLLQDEADDLISLSEGKAAQWNAQRIRQQWIRE